MIARALVRAVAVGCAAVLFAVPAAAQEARPPIQDLQALAGRPVAAVRMQIEGRPEPSPALRTLVRIREGQPLSVAEVRESVQHLYAVERFENVEVSAVDGPMGIEITFNLSPIHPIDRLEFRGNAGVPAAQLERTLRQRFGGFPNAARLAVAEAEVRRVLRQEGYESASLEMTTEKRHDPDRATLVFTIDAGPRTTIASTDIAGASPLAAEVLKTRTGTLPGQPYRQRSVEDALADIADELRAAGYYEATATHSAARVPGPDSRVAVTLFVEAGRPVDIRFAGWTPSKRELENLVPLRRESSADNDLLDDSTRRIEARLRRDGYWKARAPWAREVRDDRTIVTFTVTPGARYRLAQVSAAGNAHFTQEALDRLLDLNIGAPFAEAQVAGGLARLRAAYIQAGFDQVAMTPEVHELPALPTGEGQAELLLNLIEGPQRRFAEINIVGASAVSEAELRGVMFSKVGDPYQGAFVAVDQRRLEGHYLDRGYQSVAVAIAESPADQPAVTLTVTVNEGPQTLVDHLIVVGNRRMATASILNEVVLREGQPLGLADATESHRRLAELQMFRSIRIRETPRVGAETRVDVIIEVEEAAATTLGVGGGLEVRDRTVISPRGFFEVGRRNLWGGNRSLNLFSRISLTPRRRETGLGFTQYRVTLTYREPRAFGSTTSVGIGASAEQAIRTSFDFIRQALNAEFGWRERSRLNYFGRYTLDSTRLFINKAIPIENRLNIDRLFPQVRLSTMSGGAIFDGRDNPLDPTVGMFVSGDAALALRAIGSEVGFVKMFGQASAFRRVTRQNRIVLAARAQFGVARGFEREVPRLTDAGEPVIAADGLPATQTVDEVPASQRFFAGGSTSVRGFQLDRLGEAAVLTETGLSNGGNGLIVLNGEVRTLLRPDLSLVTFVDAGNVFARASRVSVGALRMAAGAGIRYRSPLGPVRLDFGFKLDRRIIGGKRERGWEFHLSLGEVF